MKDKDKKWEKEKLPKLPTAVLPEVTERCSSEDDATSVTFSNWELQRCKLTESAI